MKNDNNKNKRETWRLAIRLLEKLLTRRNVHKTLIKNRRLKMGRICVELSDQLEKQLSCEKCGKAEKNATTKSADYSFYNESDFDHSPVFNNLVVLYLRITPLHVN